MSVCEKVSYFPQRETGNCRSSITQYWDFILTLFSIAQSAELRGYAEHSCKSYQTHLVNVSSFSYLRNSVQVEHCVCVGGGVMWGVEYKHICSDECTQVCLEAR